MPNLQVFDRINVLNGPKLRSMEFDKYFGEMGLTEEQTEERISLAEDLEKDMLYFFYLMIAQSQYETELDVNEEMNARFRETIGNHMEISDRLDDHITELVDDIERVTALHLATLIVLTDEVNRDIASQAEEQSKEAEDREKKLESEQYWLSDDRARFIAEEESNTAFNDSDFEDAIEAGYTMKTWNTMLDRYVRKTHRPMEGKTIPIDDYFIVGNSMMLYPRDPDGDPEEVISCRCWLTYE